VRSKHLWALRAHMLDQLRAIIFWRLTGYFQNNFAAMQLDCNSFLYLPKALISPSLDFDLLSVNIVQTEQFVPDCKDTIVNAANQFWLHLFGSGKGESHCAHQRVTFGPNRKAQSKNNPDSARISQ